MDEMGLGSAGVWAAIPGAASADERSDSTLCRTALRATLQHGERAEHTDRVGGCGCRHARSMGGACVCAPERRSTAASQAQLCRGGAFTLADSS